MKVGIITGDHTESETGIGNYILNLISELKKTDQEISVIRHPNGYNYGVKNQIVPYTPDTAGLMVWSLLVLIQKGILQKLDIVHSPTMALFPIKPHENYVFTVHDIVFKKYPQFIPKGTIRHTNLLFKRNLELSDQIIAVSESTKKDIITEYRVQKEKISVIPEAADPMFRPLSNQDVEKIRKKYLLPHSFILYLGTIEPRKNISQIFEAFSNIQAKIPEMKLVIAGKKGWYYEEIFQRLLQLRISDKVIFLGYVPISDLPALYNAATIFVYPSQYEGFGLPPIEAMQCGTPVITSNRSSLPEVVGKEGILINPDSPEQIGNAIIKLINDPIYFQNQINYGIEQAKKFSWRKTAEMTTQVYEEVISR